MPIGVRPSLLVAVDRELRLRVGHRRSQNGHKLSSSSKNPPTSSRHSKPEINAEETRWIVVIRRQVNSAEMAKRINGLSTQ